MDEAFGSSQVIKIVGITYRQLDWWARIDLIVPSITSAEGSGTHRLYSYSDLLELKVLKRLIDAGLSLPAAGKAIECLCSGAVSDDLGSATLVVNGTVSVLIRSDEEIIDVLNAGQGVLSLVPMSDLVSELDAAITELRSAEDDEDFSSRSLLSTNW